MRAIAGRILTPTEERRSLGAILAASPLVGGGGMLMFVAVSVVNLGNFGFHAIVSRAVGPSSYGVVGSLLGILVILQVPMSALEVACVRSVAARPSTESDFNLGPVLLRAMAIAGAALLGLMAAAPFLRGFLHLQSAAPVVLTGCVMAFTMLGLVPKSLLLGRRRFATLAKSLILGAVVKFGSTVVFASLWPGVVSALASSTLGEATTSVLCLWSTRASFRRHGPPLRIAPAEAGGTVVAFAGFWALCSIDTLLARHFLPGARAGFYAAASTAAQLVLFLPGAVALVAFPTFADRAASAVVRRRVLMQAWLVTGVIGLCAAAGIALLPQLTIGALFGSQFLPSRPIIGILGLGAVMLGLTNVGVYYLVASRSRAAAAPWFGVAGAVTLLWWRHQTVAAIATSMLAIDAALFGVTLLAVLTASRRRLELDPTRNLWRSPSAELDATIVIPHAVANVLFATNVNRLAQALRHEGVSFEIVAVLQDATSDVASLVDLIDEDEFRLLRVPETSDTVTSLRLGLESARGQYIGFVDADGDLDPEILTPFLRVASLYRPDIVVGSKRHPMSEVDYPIGRRICSLGYQLVVAALFRLNLRDTQAGTKLVRREVLAAALPRMVEKRYCFDLELLVVARRLGYSRFFEAPVRVRGQFRNSVSLGSARGIAMDTLAIFYRLRLLRFYDEDVRAPGPRASDFVGQPGLLDTLPAVDHGIR